jgi:hypothetical protein
MHLECLQRHGGDALGAFDNAVAQTWGFVQDVVGIKARSGDLGLHESDIGSRGYLSCATRSARAICQPAITLPVSIR